MKVNYLFSTKTSAKSLCKSPQTKLINTYICQCDETQLVTVATSTNQSLCNSDSIFTKRPPVENSVSLTNFKQPNKKVLQYKFKTVFHYTPTYVYYLRILHQNFFPKFYTHGYNCGYIDRKHCYCESN